MNLLVLIASISGWPWLVWCGFLWLSLVWCKAPTSRNIQEALQVTMPIAVGLIAVSAIRT